jgi:ankyrin repeat protein
MKKLKLSLLLLLSSSAISLYSYEDSALLSSSPKNFFLQMRLSWAAKRGNLKKVVELIQKGADPSYFFRGAAIEGTPLMLAAGSGHKEVVEYLLNDFRIYRTLNARDIANRTAVRRAEMNGHSNVVALLAEIPGIDLMVQDCLLTRCGMRIPGSTVGQIRLHRHSN